MSWAVAVLVWTNIFTVYGLMSCLNIVGDIKKNLPNKFYVLIPTFVLWGVIYYGIARPKRFLNYNFQKSVKGGFLVVAYMVLTAVAFVIVANINRERLEKERLANPVKTEDVRKKRPSLEGKIRKWFKDN